MIGPGFPAVHGAFAGTFAPPNARGLPTRHVDCHVQYPACQPDERQIGVEPIPDAGFTPTPRSLRWAVRLRLGCCQIPPVFSSSGSASVVSSSSTYASRESLFNGAAVIFGLWQNGFVQTADVSRTEHRKRSPPVSPAALAPAPTALNVTKVLLGRDRPGAARSTLPFATRSPFAGVGWRWVEQVGVGVELADQRQLMRWR